MAQQQTAATQQPEKAASGTIPPAPMPAAVQPEIPAQQAPSGTPPPTPEPPAAPAEKSSDAENPRRAGEKSPDAPAVPKRRKHPAGKASHSDTPPGKETAAPEKKAAATGKKSTAPGKKTAGGSYRKKRRRPSPVPVSMWLIPPLRLPFSTPLELLRWFITGINFWAVGAVVLCALAGWQLVERFSQPRQLGVEQALAGGEGTRGLTYIVEQTGEQEVTVTGRWDEEAGQSAPDARLAAALCAALSPEEIYGHSDHLYRAIAGRFFEGKDFTLTITLREAPGKDKDAEEPEPIFTVTRSPKDKDWPQPDCAAAFARRWREAYDEYWLFGQGRKEDLGPPQSDPIIEEGDLPPEEDNGDNSSEEEAPPLPDLDGEDTDTPSGPEDDQGGNPAEPNGEDEDPPQSALTPASSASGSSSGGEEDGDVPEDFLAKLLAYAARFRGLSWEEAWDLFWAKE